MHEDIFRSFNRVLGPCLAVVQQHFIHVLMLRAWNEDAGAARISSIDAVDLPNAMRIVDYVVSAGYVPTLASDRRKLVANMPGAGDSPKAVYAAEERLDGELKDVLTSVERELRQYERNVPIEFVSTPLESRAAYQNWLRQQLELPCDGVKPGELGEPAKLSLDSLFANLMVMIDQTLVHAFIHWHGGEFGLADSVWEMCGAAMMHAAGIVNSLAYRHIAPDPTRSVKEDNVAFPCTVAAPSEALASDHLLAERCLAAAKRAASTQQEPDLADACCEIEIYYGELVCWRPGRKLPRLDNPCVDFERVIRKYVWNGCSGSASLA